MIRRLLVWLLASAFLVGCYSLRPESRPLNEAEAELIGRTLADWHTARLPSPKPSCVLEQAARWRVAYLKGDELNNLCTKRSCFIDDSSGFALWPDVYPTAVIPEHYDEAERMSKLREQALRWLSWCSGLGLDPQKKNQDVWRLAE